MHNRTNATLAFVQPRRDTATHCVNGRVVNYARDIKKPDPDNPAHRIPLTAGSYLLEAVGSQIWFRNIKVKPIEPAQKP